MFINFPYFMYYKARAVSTEMNDDEKRVDINLNINLNIAKAETKLNDPVTESSLGILQT